MTYVYTILMNDVFISRFDVESELWYEAEEKGGQPADVKMVRDVLKDMSRIRKLRRFLIRLT
jgi:hypothetical protein